VLLLDAGDDKLKGVIFLKLSLKLYREAKLPKRAKSQRHSVFFSKFEKLIQY
jgi:hypothetical protein